MRDLNSLNIYGVPLHATFGVRQDAHYWCYVRTLPVYKAIMLAVIASAKNPS